MSSAWITCEPCTARSRARIFHSGFSNVEYLYCNSCCCTAILDFFSERSAILRDLATRGWWSWRASTTSCSQIEGTLDDCGCGGRFTFEAEPRCPVCQHVLDLASVKRQLDAESWWRSDAWRPREDGYFLVLEENSVTDPYR